MDGLLSKVKANLILEHAADDALIQSYITAAVSYTSTKTAHFRTHDHSAFKNFFSAVSPVRMLLRTALSFTFSRLAIFALLSPSR